MDGHWITVVGGSIGVAIMYAEHRKKHPRPRHVVDVHYLKQQVKYVLQLLLAGIVAVTGIVLIVLIFTWPLGVALLILAGRIPQSHYEWQLQRELEAENNRLLKDTTPEVEDEEDLPWVV